jgi:peptidoglycan-associated lipoprotein
VSFNHPHAWLAGAIVLVCARASAQPSERVSVRVTSSAALMLGADQVGRMEYDQAGVLANASLAYSWRPWFDTQAGVRGGGFISGAGTGGLFAPTAGIRFSNGFRRIAPYVCLDAGAAFTGNLVRPYLGISGGLDIAVGRLFAMGPVLGFDDVVQWNQPGHSTDAFFAWIGLSVRYRYAERPVPPKPRPAPVAVAPPPPAEPGQSLPDPELIELIERSVGGPAARVELLAPVLFAFDSEQLEPIGVAMLHEVAHTLRERSDIRLLEIEGYTDRRGDPAHNRALSAARAERVRAWLVAHGIAPERLRVAAHGADGAVEVGSDESAYQQNRRVVFRVLEVASP